MPWLVAAAVYLLLMALGGRWASRAFIDGRTELYGEQFMLRYYRGVMLEDLPDFLKLLDDYRIETTLLVPPRRRALLDRLPEWRRVYADPTAVYLHTPSRFSRIGVDHSRSAATVLTP